MKIVMAYVFWVIFSTTVAVGLSYFMHREQYLLLANLPYYLVPIVAVTVAGVWRSHAKKKNPFLGGFHGMLGGIFLLALFFGLLLCALSRSP